MDTDTIKYGLEILVKDFINLIDTDLKFVNLSDAGKKPAYGSIDEDKLIKIFADLSM